jgi:hypothetical protein
VSVPAAGEHSTEAIKAAHDAIEVIDQLVRGLYEASWSTRSRWTRTRERPKGGTYRASMN